MADGEVLERMREDWNRRAREDARYYVAFGRREQSDEEFEATAADVVRHLTREFARLDAGRPIAARRALEIGCGPGRLLRPMSQWFGEIHGVDVADEMVRQARERLAGIPHAHAHVARNSNLEAFASQSFDFVYSYAVFQHIPSRDVVLGYLEEARRVLRVGGILKAQFNGLPRSQASYDTWAGVRISAAELRELAEERGWQLLALEGDETQYLWCTMAKREEGWRGVMRARLAETAPGRARIRRITNAFSSEPVVPARGRFACASLWLEGGADGRALPVDCDLTGLAAKVGDAVLECSYLGPPERDGMQQVNVPLSGRVTSGVSSIELRWWGAAVSEPGTLRVIPPAACVPRLISVSDGVNLLATNVIASRVIKLVWEELEHPEAVGARLGERELEGFEVFCADPLPPRYEMNVVVPEEVAPGRYPLKVRIGARRFAPVMLEIAS